jgi:hypothetical protein
MGWAAGVYTRLFGSTGWADDKNASTKILASRHDSHDQDVATALNNCILRDGTGVPTAIKRDGTAAPTANVGWGTFKITGLGDPTSAQDAATKAYVDTSGSFTATLTGCTTSPTATAYYAKAGNVVVIYIPTVTATSNAATCTLTGAPAAIFPTRTQWVAVPDGMMIDNGAVVQASASKGCYIQVGTGALVTFGISGGSWTSSGTKGINNPHTITYLLN